VVQKGYGQVTLSESGEEIEGEITLHAEGWVAVSPINRKDDGEVRWFPNHRVAELVWRKQLAMRPPER
jgi:hypothetical protein